jgi:hypothetical protein
MIKKQKRKKAKPSVSPESLLKTEYSIERRIKKAFFYKN